MPDAAATTVGGDPKWWAKTVELPAGASRSPMVEGARRTFGLSDQPATRSMLDVIANPQGVLEHAASIALTAPAVMAGGAGAGLLGARAGVPVLTKVAPVAGRVLTSGAIGAGKAEMRGDDPVKAAIIDSLVAVLGEGGAAAVRGARIPFVGGLADAGKASQGYEAGTQGVRDALAAVDPRLPTIRLVIPSLGNTKITFEEAIKKLVGVGKDKGLHHNDYIVARGEIIDAMNRVESAMLKAAGQGRPLGPRAGTLFGGLTVKERFPASTASEVAEGTRRVLAANPTRAAIDALATEPTEAGVPLGAIAANALWNATGGNVSRWLGR